MRAQSIEGLRAGDYHGTKNLRLQSCGLFDFPLEILDLADTLEMLDLSNNPLTKLPNDFSRLHNLKIAFFSNCSFKIFPQQLAQCGSLEIVAFRGNGMMTIPEGALPPKLRWLILTNNLIEALPQSIGNCNRLQKVMLAGNRLIGLPEEMARCQRLGLLRISTNRIAQLPSWLFNMPELAFLSFAGNPCVPSHREYTPLEEIDWSDLSVSEILGEGASGIISRGVWKAKDENMEKDVAIKLFKGEVTSDGAPGDEMDICMAAGSHPNLIDPLGKIGGRPDKRGLVLQLIPPTFTNLGLPPTLQSCTRDAFYPGKAISFGECKAILSSVASAAAHLHFRGIAHGDLYAHNVLVDDSGYALLGDFGAATIYRKASVKPKAFERMEALAFGHLVEDMVGLLDPISSEHHEPALDVLQSLHQLCTHPLVENRPLFAEICDIFQSL
jgi:hypothetical protein